MKSSSSLTLSSLLSSSQSLHETVAKWDKGGFTLRYTHQKPQLLNVNYETLVSLISMGDKQLHSNAASLASQVQLTCSFTTFLHCFYSHAPRPNSLPLTLDHYPTFTDPHQSCWALQTNLMVSHFNDLWHCRHLRNLSWVSQVTLQPLWASPVACCHLLRCLLTQH